MNQYNKKFGWGSLDILLEDSGLTYDDIADAEGGYKLIDGITKQYKNMEPTSIIFGVMEEYRDPSF